MEKLAVFLVYLLGSFGFVQGQYYLSGTVSNENGDPLIGATLIIKETNIGTITDGEGTFSIRVHQGGETLLVSYIGCETKEIAIEGRAFIDVVLNTSVEDLDEIIVTGYSEVNRSELISSLAVVDDQQIENEPTTNINQSLQGRVPGLFTTAHSGQPGASQIVRIRGTGSINAGADPLYVIDGIIVQHGDLITLGEDYEEPNACCASEPDVLSQINPNDVETVTVLKDASATALYGSRGSNGVIVVTTKKGKPGPTRINLKTYTGITMPNLGRFELMTAEEQWNYERTIMELSGYSAEQMDELRPVSMLDNTTDWLDEAFKNGKIYNIDLQARGGGEKTRFYISGGYFFQEGTMLGTDFERYSLRSNIDHTISDRMDLSFNINGSYSLRNNAPLGAFPESPMLQIYFNTPMQGKTDPDTGELYTGTEEDWIGNVRDNFLNSIPKNRNTVDNFRLLSKLSTSYRIMDGLKFTQSLNIDLIAGDELTYLDPNTGVGMPGNGRLSHDFMQNIALTNQSKLKYITNIGLDHRLDILGVFEYQRVHWKGFGADGSDFLTGGLQTLASAGITSANRGHKTDYAFLSYLGLLNYGYKGRYFLTSSFRRDGSSRFGPNNRWANFWSAGASWQIGKEAFLEDVDLMNSLRLRLSFGTSGNAAIGNSNWQSLYVYGANYNGQAGVSQLQFGNPNLGWELSKSLNAGLDFSLLDERVGGTIEYYDRRSEDLLMDAPLSATSGFSSTKRNVGKVQNSGLEIQLNLRPLKAQNTGGFNWDLNFNISFNDNKVLELPNGTDIIYKFGILREGYPVRSIYTAKWAGVNPDDGSIRFLQRDGTYTSIGSKADKYIVGSTHPDLLAGLTNRFSYKGVSLSLFFYTAQGHVIDAGVFGYMDSDGQRIGAVHLKDAGDFWAKPGDEADRPMPQIGGVKGADFPSDRWLEDGSFIRLRNVEMSFTLPARWREKAKLQKAVIFLQGQNLLTITNYTGMDPEGNEWGRDNWRYPVGKSVTFGLDLSF